MKNTQYILSALFFLTLCQSMFAGTPSGKAPVVSNVVAYMSGTIVTIEYDLSMEEDLNECATSLLVSLDGGKSFTFAPKLSCLKGDIGKIKTEGHKIVKYDLSSDASMLNGKDLTFKIEVDTKHLMKRADNVVGICASVYPQFSGGIQFERVRKVGWYVKARVSHNYFDQPFRVSCDRFGVPEYGDERYWFTDDIYKPSISISCGMVFKIYNVFYPYIGVGEFDRTYYRGIEGSSERAFVEDYYYFGVAADAGLQYRIKNIMLSAGVQKSLQFKQYFELELGVSYVF